MDKTPTLSIYFIDVGLSTENFMNAAHAGRLLVGVPGGRAPEVLLTNQELPDGIDVSKVSRRIFWTSMGMPKVDNGALFSCDLSGRDIKTVIGRHSILHTPKQLLVDDQGSKIYVCDREGLKVVRCNPDGSELEILVTTGDSEDENHRADPSRWCVGIAVCHRTGKFYWSQKGPSKGGKGRIFRANIDFLDGENAENRSDVECVLQNLPEPINLSIDQERGELYWTDRGELPLGNSINRVSIRSLRPIQHGDQTVSWPGKDYELLVRNMHEAIGIKLDLLNKHIYATDLGGRVYRFGLDGRNGETFYESQGTYAGITLVWT
ncbi:3-hydroxyacyl-CoA dehydrogenase [Xylaria intraflava]|nr:3-hydroxyacyl-CoA dehydrogenase [Xylaria intraflava]